MHESRFSHWVIFQLLNISHWNEKESKKQGKKAVNGVRKSNKSRSVAALKSIVLKPLDKTAAAQSVVSARSWEREVSPPLLPPHRVRGVAMLGEIDVNRKVTPSRARGITAGGEKEEEATERSSRYVKERWRGCRVLRSALASSLGVYVCS